MNNYAGNLVKNMKSFTHAEKGGNFLERKGRIWMDTPFSVSLWKFFVFGKYLKNPHKL